MSNDLMKQDILTPENFKQALEFAKVMSSSDLVPKDFKGKPENVLVAIQWGAELGLKPMQAMHNIAVINGRPAIWGDAQLAIVQSHPAYEWIKETDDGNEATCIIKRKGEDPHISKFSMADAQTAGLKGKQGPWTQYPKRMRQMRARAFALRDKFPDALKGIDCAEEAQDMPKEKNMGAADVVNKMANNLSAPKVQPIKVESKPIETIDYQTGEVTPPTLEAVLEAINASESIDDLEAAKQGATLLEGEARAETVKSYKAKKKEILQRTSEENSEVEKKADGWDEFQNGTL